MGVDVSAFDGGTAAQPLITTPTLDVVATDRTGRRLARATTTRAGLASLSFGIGRFAYTVTVVDPSSTFAPAVVTDLNGNTSLTLELVLFPLPPPHGGVFSGPSSRADVPDYIDQQTWSAEEKVGARRLVRAYEDVVEEGRKLESDLLRAIEDALRSIGIAKDLFYKVAKNWATY